MVTFLYNVGGRGLSKPLCTQIIILIPTLSTLKVKQDTAEQGASHLLLGFRAKAQRLS